jgi:type I restriction enzyme S subunit
MAYKQVLLGDYFKFEKGLGYKGEFLAEDSDVALIGMDSHEEGGGYKEGSEKFYSGPFKSEHVAEVGDVIFAGTEQGFGLLASPLIVPESEKFNTYLFSGDVLKAIPLKSDEFSVEYLYNIYRVEKYRVKTAYGDTGTTVRRISNENFAEQLVPLPDLSTQLAIIEIISLIDQQIANNKSLSKNLELLAQSIFKSWFIDFDPVHAKSIGEKPFGMDDETAALFPETFEESELGMIPKGWNVDPASSLFDFSIGRTPPRKESSWFCAPGLGHTWVSIKDMGSYGVFTQTSAENLTVNAVERYRVPIVPTGTVLMSFKLTLGRIAITSEPLATNEAIAHFIPRTKDSLSSEYTYLFLKNFDYGNLDNTSSIANATNSSQVKNILFLRPSDSVLGVFQKQVSPLFKQIEILAGQNRSLEMLRNSLLPRFISGELQIPEEMLAS